MPHRNVTCICGKAFQAHPRAINAKYCSQTCSNDARIRRCRAKSPPTGPLRYSEAELEFIKANYRSLGPKGCARALRRGWHGVQTKANLLGVRSNKWSQQEIRYVREHYTVDGAVKVGEVLRRKPTNVMTIASKYSIPAPPREKTPTPTIRARAIIARVAIDHGCTSYDILSNNKRRKILPARWQVMRELRDLNYSTTKIGDCLGVDHSTVCNGLNRWLEIAVHREAAE